MGAHLGYIGIFFAGAGLLRDFEDANLRVADGVGVVIDVDLFYVGFAFFEVEMFDVILLRAVEIDGFFVDGGERAGEIDFADDFGLAGDVDDDEIIAGDGAEADGVGRVGFLRPVKMIAGAMEETGFGHAGAEIGDIDFAEGFAGGDGKFERGALQMID